MGVFRKEAAMLDAAYARERMVSRQVASRGIHDDHVLDALRAVPREAFVPEGMEEFAYEDSPLPFGSGQTIPQPYIVALIIEGAGLRPGGRVRGNGNGSAWTGVGEGMRLCVSVNTVGRVYI